MRAGCDEDNHVIEHIRKRFAEHAAVTGEAGERLAATIARAAETIIAAYRAGGGVFAFGNGGSAADAEHIVCELVGRFYKQRRALKAQALTTNPALVSAVANDYAFDRVFVRQLEAAGSAGDVAIALSTSGDSANVVAALDAARRMGMKTIALTGAGGGGCAPLADVLLDVPSRDTPRVQEAHAVIYHVLCELVEAALADEG
jgi:D-sedoheptulose 7-phosphate isomerase